MIARGDMTICVKRADLLACVRANLLTIPRDIPYCASTFGVGHDLRNTHQCELDTGPILNARSSHVDDQFAEMAGCTHALICRSSIRKGEFLGDDRTKIMSCNRAVHFFKHII